MSSKKSYNLSNKSLPAKWHEVFPYGTTAGDEEQRFFIALARNADYIWRSVAALAKDARLTAERVEQIIAKYLSSSIVLQQKNNDAHFAYWENAPESLPEKYRSLVEVDQESRVDGF